MDGHKKEEHTDFERKIYPITPDECFRGSEWYAKQVKDLKNKYKSQLQQEGVPKLSKTPNFKKQFALECYIEILDELLNKII